MWSWRSRAEAEPEEEKEEECDAVLEMVIEKNTKTDLIQAKKTLTRKDALKIYATLADEAQVDVIPYGIGIAARGARPSELVSSRLLLLWVYVLYGEY